MSPQACPARPGSGALSGYDGAKGVGAEKESKASAQAPLENRGAGKLRPTHLAVRSVVHQAEQLLLLLLGPGLVVFGGLGVNCGYGEPVLGCRGRAHERLRARDRSCSEELVATDGGMLTGVHALLQIRLRL